VFRGFLEGGAFMTLPSSQTCTVSTVELQSGWKWSWIRRGVTIPRFLWTGYRKPRGTCRSRWCPIPDSKL